MKKIVLSFFVLLLSLRGMAGTMQELRMTGNEPLPIKVNFCALGKVTTNSEWNNFTNAGTPSGSSVQLNDIEGNATDVTIALKSAFNGTNTEGVASTNTVLNMTSQESYSAFWAQALNTSGTTNKASAGFVISGLKANYVYDFVVFGSRKNQTDNRETSYRFVGSNEEEGLLNCSSNAPEVAVVSGVSPDANGQIELIIAPGANNNNSVKYYYINAMQITPRVNTNTNIAHGTTLKVNFCASNLATTTKGWNNFTNATNTSGTSLRLTDVEGKVTTISIALESAFNGTNQEGVQTNGTIINMTDKESYTAFWAQALNTNGSANKPSAGFVIGGLDDDYVYDFTIFGSRKNVTDNRETSYRFVGSNEKEGLLNCSGNASNVVTVTDVSPNSNGQITLTLSPGENNNNNVRYYYINAMQIDIRKKNTPALPKLRVLAIGNSFSEDAVEQYLYNLGKEAGVNLIIGNACRGGQGLQSHWNDIQNNNNTFEYRKVVNGTRTNTTGQALSTIVTDEPWDIITFQQVSQNSGQPNTYEPWLGYLIDYVKGLATNENVKMGLHQTWAYAQNSTHSGFVNYDNDQMTMYNAIVGAVNQAAANHEELTFIIPSGTAIQNARTSFLGDNLNRDGYHLDYGIGRYTAACTWLEAIIGVSSVGMSYRPDTVDEMMAEIAQNAAHYAMEQPNSVTDMANTGYGGDNTIIPSDVIKINFGESLVTAAEWNSITPNYRFIASLKDARGSNTDVAIAYDDPFNGYNAFGATSTTTPLNMPSDVSKSCLWGYAQGSFGNQAQQPTGGFVFRHLNKNLAYDFTFFGSRDNCSDNRETVYTLTGEKESVGYLDAAGNSSETVTVSGVRPDANGEIRLVVSPGDNNTNTYKFYYINALQIEAYVPTTVTQAISANYAADGKAYDTLYYGTLNLRVPSGVKASTYLVEDGKLKENHVYAENEVIPAATAVVLTADASGDYVFAITEDAGQSDASNMLRGSDVDVTVDVEGFKYYILSKSIDGQKLGFFFQNIDGTSVTTKAHKAYLAVPDAVATAKGWSFGDESTGIENVKNEERNGKNSSSVYDLQGCKVANHSTLKPGIYIMNGKKSVMR